MESADILGFAAGLLTTLAFLPQVIKTWRSRHTRDISLGMFATFSSGVFLWLLYGIQVRAMPIIFTNGVTLILALTILVFKIKYK